MTGVTMLEDAPLLAAGHCPVDRPVMRPVTLVAESWQAVFLGCGPLQAR